MRSFIRQPFSLLAVGAFSALLFATPATALADPFDMDGGSWMSFDHYKDSVRRNPAAHPEAADTSAQPATAEDAAAVANIAPPGTESPATLLSGAPATNTEPVPAALSRAINVPIMPGLNKGYAMQISSTSEEEARRATIANIESKPTITLPESNWQKVEEAAKHDELEQNDNDPDNPQSKSLNVRMTYLPNASIRPVGKETKVAEAKGKDLFTKKPVTAKSAEEAAACAAVDAYKKNQLNALQRDNETLQALQQAIATLGLQKELSFMTGQNTAKPAEGKMDMPPAPTTIK